MQITYSSLRLPLLAIFLVGALAACSDGGGTESTATPSPAGSTFAAQGFWNGSLDVSNNASAVILENGDAWVVFQQGATVTGFARASLQNTGMPYAGTGTRYNANGSNPLSLSLSASAFAGSNLQATFTTGGQPATGPANLVYERRYDAPANAGDVTGRWRTTLNSGASVLTLDVTPSTGAIAGVSTTGCSYSGSLTPRPTGKAVFDLVLNENCLGTQIGLSGIGTLNETKTSLAMVFTTADQTRGGLLAAQR